MGLAGRIVSFIITTFLLAALYGFGCAVMAFVKHDRDPVGAGRYAASHVYGLFGTVSEETNTTGTGEVHSSSSVMHKIAAPYAVTADLTALLGGKLINGVASIFHTVDTKTKE